MNSTGKELILEQDARGRITLFDGNTAVIKINNKGVAKHVQRPPSWHKIKRVDYICGQSLNRVHVVKKNSRTIEAVVKRVPDSQRRIGCDTCPGKHSSLNPSCSANLKLKTFAYRPNHLYNIKTRKDIGKWLPDLTFYGRSTVGVGTFNAS